MTWNATASQTRRHPTASDRPAELSTADVVRLTGTTSRTLRHYDAIGLLPPSRVGYGGLRFYDSDALVRLQRILLLRELDVPLKGIAAALDGHRDTAAALERHVAELAAERDRLSRLISAVHHTIDAMKKGATPMATKMFDGFDHTQYREEVETRWGKDAYRRSNNWWESLSDADKQGFKNESAALITDWAAVSATSPDVSAPQVRALARRQHAWIAAAWGGKTPGKDAFIGLGDLYVSDPRFGATYTAEGREFAQFVRDAMVDFAEAELD